jgi:hypothetical protein
VKFTCGEHPQPIIAAGTKCHLPRCLHLVQGLLQAVQDTLVIVDEQHTLDRFFWAACLLLVFCQEQLFHGGSP